MVVVFFTMVFKTTLTRTTENLHTLLRFVHVKERKERFAMFWLQGTKPNDHLSSSLDTTAVASMCTTTHRAQGRKDSHSPSARSKRDTREEKKTKREEMPTQQTVKRVSRISSFYLDAQVVLTTPRLCSGVHCAH